jgi:hypothetical protein
LLQKRLDIESLSDATWWHNPTAPGDGWSEEAMGLWVNASPTQAYHAYLNYLAVQATVPSQASMSDGAWLASYSAWDIGSCLLLHGTQAYADAAHGPCGGTIVTPSPTAAQTMPSPTPTPYSGPTADGLLKIFVNDSKLSIACSADFGCIYPIANSTWFQCCGFYPAHGSYQFIDSTTNTVMRMGVFDTAADAGTDASLATQGWGWANGRSYQIGPCLLVAENYAAISTEYEADMQHYCG